MSWWFYRITDIWENFTALTLFRLGNDQIWSRDIYTRDQLKVMCGLSAPIWEVVGLSQCTNWNPTPEGCVWGWTVSRSPWWPQPQALTSQRKAVSLRLKTLGTAVFESFNSNCRTSLGQRVFSFWKRAFVLDRNIDYPDMMHPLSFLYPLYLKL